VAAALAQAAADGFDRLATAPCDAPFLPLDLVARLAAASEWAAVAVSDSGLEPTFALWPVSAQGMVEAALAEGRASPRAVLDALGAARVTFPAARLDPFANLNTPAEFAAAEAVARMQETTAPAAGRP
jgi:molybdenum cofactor guanylyltransferase